MGLLQAAERYIDDRRGASEPGRLTGARLCPRVPPIPPSRPGFMISVGETNGPPQLPRSRNPGAPRWGSGGGQAQIWASGRGWLVDEAVRGHDQVIPELR